MQSSLRHLFIFLLTAVCLVREGKGQTGVPDGFVFQSVAKDASGNAAAQKTVYISAEIAQFSASGTVVYAETFNTKTTSEGIFSIVIGKGTMVPGSRMGFAAINWLNGPFFIRIKVAIKPDNAPANWDYTKAYLDLGSTQLWSVPYAKVAGNGVDTTRLFFLRDSANLLKDYVRNSKFVSELARKINYEDSLRYFITPSQWSQARLNDSISFANSLQSVVRFQDTGSMLSAYVRKSEMASLQKGTLSVHTDKGIIGTVIDSGAKKDLLLSLGDIAPTSIVTPSGVFDSLTVKGKINAGIINGVLSSGAISSIRYLGSLDSLHVSGAIESATISSTLLSPVQPNITRVGNLSDLTVVGTISAGTLSATLSDQTLNSITSLANLDNITLTGNVTANTFSGTLTTPSQPNITRVGNLADLTVVGTLSAGSLSATLSEQTLNSITSLANLDNITLTGNVTANTFSGTLTTPSQPNITRVGNLADLTVVGTLSAGSLSTTLSEQTLNSITSLANLDNITLTGNVTANTFSGTLTTPSQPNITRVGNLSDLTVAGTLSAGSLSATLSEQTLNSITSLANLDNITLTGNVTANTFSGTLTTPSQPNITRVGNLSNLTVVGTISAGTLSATLSEQTLNSITSLANLDNITLTGNVTANTFSGTLTTPSQPNITRVGNLSDLTVVGTISAGTLSATLSDQTLNSITSLANLDNITLTGNVTANTFSGTLTTPSQPNITRVGNLSDLTVVGTISAGTLSATLSDQTLNSITSLANLDNITLTGNVTANTFSGTLTTASQPNITRVGNLSDLTVAGTLSAGTLSATLSEQTLNSITSLANLDNITLTGNVTANTFSGTLTTSSQPYITRLGRLQNLSVDGTISGNAISVVSASIQFLDQAVLPVGNASDSILGISNGAIRKLAPPKTDTFSNDFVVNGVSNFLKWVNGETVPAKGKTALELLLEGSAKRNHPTYSAPTITFSTSPAGGNIEIGSTFPVTLNANFTQNDAGALQTLSYKKNGSDLSGASDMVNSITSTIQYSVVASYAQGACKNDNLGSPDCTGQIAAGSISSNTVSIIPLALRYWGYVNSSSPSDAEIRAVSGGGSEFATSRNKSSFSINIPDGTRYLLFAYPASFGPLTSLSAGGFESLATFTGTTRTFVNAKGYSQSYYIYISNNAFSESISSIVTN